MNQRISSYYRTLAWVALFIVIGSLYAYYFLIYVSEREDQVVARGFRILNNYRLNMQDKDQLNVKRVNTLGESFIKRDLYYYLASCDSIERQNNEKRKSGEQKIENQREDPNQDDNWIKLLNNGECYGKDSFRLNYIEYSNFLSDKIKFQIGDSLDVCPDGNYSQCISRNERSFLVNTPNAPPFIIYKLFRVREHLPKIISNNDIELNYEPAMGSVGYIKTTLHDFLSGLKYDDLLENLVVLNKGKVIYNENPEEFVYSDKNLDTLTDKSAPSGSYKFVTVNSIRKMAISMPVTIFNHDLLIIGFIDGDLFSQLTRSINAHLLFVLASLILFLIIIFPFLKVYLISQNERLGSEDIYFSGFSVILGASLGVLIIFGLYNHFILENNLIKEKLTSATRYMKTEISSDISRAVRFKNAIIDSLQQHGDYLTPDSVQLNYQSLVHDTAFDFNELLLLNSTDGHFEYMLVLPGNRRPEEHLKDNQVSYRTYFQRARDNRLWHVNLKSTGSEHLFIESIYSIASQKGEAAISFPKIKLFTAYGNFPITVVPVVTSTLPSLFKPILPKDMSFAIVDSECKTLFHENYRKNDKENFWVETGNNKHLKSIIDQRITDFVRLNYNQKTWVAKVSPIWGTELFMIVMYDKTINYYKDARIIFFGFLFLLSTMILVVSYSFIVRITKPTFNILNIRRFSFSWLTYNPNNYYRYNILITWFCLLFAISILATVFIDSVDTALFHVIYLLSFLSLLASALLTKKTYIIRHFWWKENRLVSYQLIIFILINFAIIIFIFNRICWRTDCHTPGFVNFMLFYPLLSTLLLYSIRDASKRLYKYHYAHEIDKSKLPIFPYWWINFDKTYQQYLVFFFMWLILISLGPTVLFFKVSYLSENRLWNKWQQMHLVKDWLEQRHEGVRNTSSLKMDSICSIEVAKDQKYDHNLITNESIKELAIDKRILKDLRMPVTGNKEDMSGFLFENATDSLYYWKEDTLFYYDAIDQKMIKVSSSEYDFEKLITNKSSIALWIALIVFLGIAYQAMRYLINMIFYSEPSNHLLNISPDLNELINQVDSDRNILIVGYDSNEALRKYQVNWPEYEIVSLLDEKQVEKIVEHSYLSSGKRKKFIFLNFEYINGGLKEFKNVVEVLQKLSLRPEHKVVLGCATDIDVLRHKLTAKIKQSQYSEDNKKEQQWLITRLDQLLADYMEMQLPLVYLDNCAEEDRIKRQDDIRTHVVLDDFIKKELSYGYFLHDIRCNAYIDKTIAASSDDIYMKKDLWKVNIRESLKDLVTHYWEKIRGKNPRRSWRPVKSILDFNYENMLMTPGAADELRNRKENIVLRVNNIAENYYQYLWNNCSAEEKLILYDLAEDEITNSKNRYVLKKLIKKGLIIHDNKLRIFNLSFRNFIMTFTRKDEATMLESAARSKGRWNNSRLILLTVILSALIFMFIAEQRIIDKALGLLSASIAILPALYKLFDSVLKRSTTKPEV